MAKLPLFASKYNVNPGMSRKVLPFVLFSVLLQTSFAQPSRQNWVDSVFNTLSRQEKAAQLFLVTAPANPTEDDVDDLEDLANDGVGGIYITSGSPLSHVLMMNKLQQKAQAPLFFAAAAEWGIAQSIDSVVGFVKPMAAGALPSDSLVQLWASSMARQMKEMGITLNFAPNADDQVFSGDYLRYFSDNPKRVADRAVVLVRALQSEGVLSIAKHLPRRWSEEQPLPDSMLVLSLNRIDTSSLGPFQKLIRAGIAGISTDYLHFSIQNEQGIVPASISQVFVPEVLRRRLGFQGLVFADATSIRRKAGQQRAGEAELFAFQVGADIIYNPVDVSAGFKKIVREVRRNKLLQAQLDASVRKILAAKYDAGLYQPGPINTDNLLRRLNSPEFHRVNDLISGAAVTVVQNTDSLLPIRGLENLSIASISIGRDAGNQFDTMLRKYSSVRSLTVKEAVDTAHIALTSNELIIVGVFPYQGALEQRVGAWINRISMTNRVILVHFGNPMMLGRYTAANVLIAAYTDQDLMASAAAQVIFGARPAVGTLPVTVGSWPVGTTVHTTSLQRLSYGVPESVGVSSLGLERIRPIMEEAIAMGATPGCYTLVVKDGKVIYQQSAGYLTYEKKATVNDQTLYDLASVTKISATLQTVLFMYDHGLIDLNKKISVYLPELKNSNKADFTLKDILTHQAGLWPFLPFWVQTMSDKNWKPEYYSNSKSMEYPFPVSQNLYASKFMKDSLWQWIIKARVRDKPPRTPYDYRYSDMGFYIFQHLAEKILNQPMEDFLAQNLYEPLGAYTTGYLPLQRFPRERIAPTENDTLFRKSQLVGYVHDQGAAMHGGIAGHAGLFSTANDLAKLGQMWLQKGVYGGQQFYKPETVELFTTKQYSDSRRGLGWDKSTPSDWSGPTSLYASTRTFGHTGFTGTCIWVDPEFNLVYVFLSNRVMPDMNNNKLLSANIRPRIQDAIYQAIFEYCGEGK